jgi:hypothetical protein
MHFLAMIYLVALAAILVAGVRHAQLGWLRAAVGVFLLTWAVLIVTAQLLSLFSALNVTWLFAGLSIVIAAVASAGLRKMRPTRELSFPEFESPFSPRVAAWVMAFLVVSAILVLIGDLKLAKGFLPANPDSIVYRFPRVYWYFGNGSLAHFSNQSEPRPQFYPLNGTIAYLPLLHFQLGPRSFSLMSLACWLMAGLSTYVFARDLGGPRVVATATAWLIFLTPNVLLQSLSTNDELIAAAPLLAGLFFLHRWFHARQPFDALIGVIGLAISAGTKLHVTFYMPLLAVIAVVLAIHHRSVWAEVRGWLSLRGVAFIVLLASIVAVFAFSFLIYNYRASGQLMAWDYGALIQNKPFHIVAALQNIVLQTANFVLTPVADLHLGSAIGSRPRALHYQAFNDWFAPLFAWVDNGPAFMSVEYRFAGVNTANSILFNEQTVYIGFVWLVWLIAALWLFSRSDSRLEWARFHAASFPVWIVTYAATSRYVEGFSVYLGYATIVMAPVMVFAFAPIKRARLAQLRLAVLAAVAATHAFFAASILYTSPAKNLVSLAHTTVLPSSRGFTVDQSVTDEVGRAKGGVYHHSIAWGQPYWAFMAYRPEIKQFLASQPVPLPVQPGEDGSPVAAALRYSRYLTPPANAPALHVYSFPQFPAYGHAIPLRIPDKVSPGLTWIGDLLFALGPEWVFAAGNAVEARFPGRDKYIVVPYVELSNYGRNAEPAIRITPTIYGLGSKDDLKFRFEVRIDGTIVSSSDWQAVPEADLATPGIKPGNAVLTMHVRNDNAGGPVYSTGAILQSTKPLPLTPPALR